MSIPEPEGLYAVVRAWWAPAHHLAAPAEQVTYVKGPSGWDDGTTYWYVLGSESGYSWEQVCEIAVHVELMREGMAAPEQPAATIAVTCSDCSRPARGDVSTEGATPAHHCRQCAEHCATRAYVLTRPSRGLAGGEASPRP